MSKSVVFFKIPSCNEELTVLCEVRRVSLETKLKCCREVSSVKMKFCSYQQLLQKVNCKPAL